MRLNILLIIHVLLRAVLTSKEFKKSVEIAKLTYGDRYCLYLYYRKP